MPLCPYDGKDASPFPFRSGSGGWIGGYIVGLQCGNMRARFMVVWVGEKGTPREGQIGLRAAENGIWSVALPRASDDDYSAWLAENYLDQENAV